MIHHHEANESPYEASPDMPSPYRPSQLNEANNSCGCRCGIGGVGEGEGGGRNDEDNASTLVDPSDHSDSGEEFPPSSDGPEQHVNVDMFHGAPEDSISLVRTRFGAFENGVEGFRLSQHIDLAVIEKRPPRLRPVQVLQNRMTDSMVNGPPSNDERSVAPSEGRSLSNRSPGPGIGFWATEDLQLNGFEFSGHGYHFLVTPLRLTPQLRYCRGLVTSHMVLPDEESFERGK